MATVYPCQGTRSIRLLRVVFAGIGAGLAYLGAQELDRKLANPRSDDLILVGGFVTLDSGLWRPIGAFNHFFVSVVFAVIYDRFLAARLPGPPWLRGALAFQVENAITWPLVMLCDRYHPAVQAGALSRLHRPVYFVQEIWRHLAFGVALGLLSPRPSR